MRNTVCFDDVLLVPQYSDIESRRTGVNISSQIGDLKLEMPIISSPMDTITGPTMAIAMHEAGGLGIIHRYNTIEDQARLVRDACMEGLCYVGAAVGVSGDFIDRACAIYDAGASVLCVDIAHGHHVLMKNALYQLREILGDSTHIMAGNVATLEAFNDLADWGANSVRVGIGGGSICSTRIQTGHGMPTLQSIIDCAQSDRDAVLIADGGIKNSGDIVKALAAGADLVMLGSLLAGTDESPGEIMHVGGGCFKVYRGMASVEAQVDWRGHASSIEGVVSQKPYTGSAQNILGDLCDGIRSGLSYSGAKNLLELQTKSIFIKQSSASMIESRPHALG